MEEVDAGKKELLVLIEYLIKHNESHNNELFDLSKNLKNYNEEAYQKVVESIKIYKEANNKLSEALNLLKKD